MYSDLWQIPGIGSGDVESILGISPNSKKNILTLWAQKVTQRRKAEMRKVNIEQNTPEWHTDFRSGGVGGSEVAAICGMNPYEDAGSIYAVKTSPVVISDKENPHMARGRKEEPYARSLYENLMGWECPPICVLHDVHDYLRASLDGLRNDDQLLLELKAPAERNHGKVLDIAAAKDQMQKFKDLLPYWYCQVQYQLYVTGCPMGHFVSFNRENFSGHDQFVLISIRPEPEYQKWMIDQVTEFWELVVSERTPN